MSLLDVLLLVAALAFAGWVALAPHGGRRWAWALGGATLLGAGAQLALEGWTWQFAPTYALLLAGGVVLARRRAGWIGRLGLVALALLATATFAVPPAPRLPAPAGPHAVGSVTYRWFEADRPEPATADPDDRRGVVVQAWYPAAPGAGGRKAPYIDGLGRLPARVNLLPGFVLETYGRIDTHAVQGAPVSPARAQWPVVLFSPGYGAPRAFYATLAADLASRGYVVLALDHPYEVAVTELADGRLATPIERFLPNDPDRLQYMELRVRTRVEDVRDVVDAAGAGRVLPGRLDLSRFAAIGHSFGGATAALALAGDARLRAGADLDGMLYGGVESKSLGRPFLVLESDRAVTGHPPLYIRRVEGLLSRLGAPGYRYEIRGSNHFSFTDAEAFFAPPARPLVRSVLGGDRPSAQVLRTTVDLLDAFLRESLDGQSGALAAAAAKQAGLSGGRAN